MAVPLEADSGLQESAPARAVPLAPGLRLSVPEGREPPRAPPSQPGLLAISDALPPTDLPSSHPLTTDI
jgi:hypothetical protein